jgi:hypothetical protein
MEANGITNPRQLRISQKLTVPISQLLRSATAYPRNENQRIFALVILI